ncbi:MAG: SCO family protein [Chloroflexi bacterium]|nr:SCO family protein [Chloroflexota bacterium]
MNGKKVFYGSLITAALVLIVFVGSQFAELNYQFQGSVFDPAQDAYKFELSDHAGGTFKLAEQNGKVVLIFFGYANCPDVCPTTLAELKRVQAALGDFANRVEIVFITVDPNRDTPEEINRYVNFFSSEFIGLSGTIEQLEPVWEAYYVTWDEAEIGTNGDYLVEHPSRIYVIDPQGKLRLTYQASAQADTITQDVIHLLRE